MLKISGKYFGTKITGLWFASRVLAGSKSITLTSRGFVDCNNMYIMGTERTAAMILSKAELGKTCVNFDFSSLKASQVRDLIRSTVRYDDTGSSLLLKYSSGKKVDESKFMRFAEPKYDLGSIKYRAKEFYEKTTFSQFMETAIWGALPATLFFGACLSRFFEISDPERKLIWLSGSGLSLSGFWSTYKMRYHERDLRETAVVNMVRIVSDIKDLAKIINILAADDISGAGAEEIGSKAKELLKTKIDLPADKKSVERIKEWIGGRICLSRINVNGSLFEILELIDQVQGFLINFYSRKEKIVVPAGIDGLELVNRLQNVRKDYETAVSSLEQNLVDLFRVLV